jgi:hypothetical protein
VAFTVESKCRVQMDFLDLFGINVLFKAASISRSGDSNHWPLAHRFESNREMEF